ncbi:hypothetical protein EVAR_9203_1 [Eumeta japonica]|uniref:FLYWCH-type domain-containing protein n=1 Tax=Eumeta variegata TaxID=151549 RepID=A0A4C1WLY1_EUMVA|nr:hypothetical protein EVAR_9203_1 [Eumeta japonica]
MPRIRSAPQSQALPPHQCQRSLAPNPYQVIAGLRVQALRSEIGRWWKGLIGTGIDCFASYCLSKQGKMGINVGGYRFRFNGCARNGKVRWRCSRGPWCKAALHTFRGRIVYIQSNHNCGPKPPAS